MEQAGGGAMSGLSYGSLFSGYGGLDLAVEQVAGAECAWQSEIDPNASTVLAHHWPQVPNHGDISSIDWADVAPVDILCGGFPCQDISSAGKQAGIKEGTRSGLWFRYADAIRVLRPRLVFVENVAALVAGGGLGVVTGSLAEVGYGCRWISLRASDVGACHRRERVFLVAWPLAPDARRGFSSPFGRGEDDRPLGHRPASQPSRSGGPPALNLLPSPRTSDTNGAGVHGDGGLDLRTAVTLLPTPMTADAEGGRHATNLRWEGGTAYRPSGAKASVSLRESLDLLPTPTTEPSTGNGHARNLGAEAKRLMPTPTVGDSKAARNSTARRSVTPPTGVHAGDTLTDAATIIERAGGDRFGPYAAAVARWELVTQRAAPCPTDAKGRLSPLFVEWMMGCAEGHVTDHGLTRSAELKMLGNGVVTLQAATAFSLMLDELAVAS